MDVKNGLTAAPVRSGLRGSSLAALWFGVLAGPLAVLANEQVEYAIVAWSCGQLDAVTSVLLHAVPIALIALSLASSLIAWRHRTRPLDTFANIAAEDEDRRGFMSLVGIGIGIFSALVILAQWIPVFYMSACAHT